jgi:hypothetical protein
MADVLQRLQQWYAEHCDGDWEHTYGIHITTIDNPGWGVEINLAGTNLRTRNFDRVSDPVDAAEFLEGDRWLTCYVEDEVWHGAGDETKLEMILETFLAWSAGDTGHDSR